MKIPDTDWQEAWAFLAALGCPPGALGSSGLQEDLSRFVGLLEAKNREVNLTAVKEPRSVLWKHLVDSLALLQWEPLGDFVDWGSGGGFPGIPLALARKHGGLPGHVHYLDSVGKKLSAIEGFSRALGLQGSQFFHCRGEDFLQKDPPRLDSVLMRAVAPAERAVHWLNPIVPRWIFLLGPQQEEQWQAQALVVKKKGFVFGEKKEFSFPSGMGTRVLLEIRKK